MSKIALAWKRFDCVVAYRRAKNSFIEPQKVWLDDLVTALQRKHPELKVSARSLYRWERKAGRRNDVMALVDTRGGDMKQKKGRRAQRTAAQRRRWKAYRIVHHDRISTNRRRRKVQRANDQFTLLQSHLLRLQKKGHTCES